MHIFYFSEPEKIELEIERNFKMLHGCLRFQDLGKKTEQK